MVIVSRLLSTMPASRARHPVLAAFLLMLLLLSGCNPSPARQTGQQPRATPAPGQTLPPVTAVAPTATAPPATTATGATPPATPCAYDYFFTPAPAICPREAAVESDAAEQPFTGGVMIWLAATDTIYVFYPDGSWQRFADTWREGDLESDLSLTPPPDRYQPIRGFGNVWREHPAVQEQLGWATSPELGYTSQIQRPVAEGEGNVFFVRTYNGQVYYLNEREPDGGEWGIAASW